MRTEICRFFVFVQYRERSNGDAAKVSAGAVLGGSRLLVGSASSPGEGHWGFLVQINMVAIKVDEGGEGECTQ